MSTTNRLRAAGLLLALACGSATAQQAPVYSLAPGRVLSATALGAGTFALGHYSASRVQPFTPAELAALDPARVPAWDRVATRYWSPRASKASDYLLLGAGLLPFSLLALPEARQEWKAVALITLNAGLLNDGVTHLVKSAARRPRPYAYQTGPLPGLAEAQASADTRLSFFSGHTSFTATASFCAASMFDDLCPKSPARPWVWAGAAVVPAVAGFLRVRAGKHYPSDVVAGYAAGALIGWLTPRWYRRR
ncbi:MAG: phosphatase PAP2 family protein [Bacteroidia bacterium]|nr:phosphatase PAP2 family protein [Bacteroidia bacterium]